MYLKELKIQGYKRFEKELQICFSNGMNVLVGENGVGKTGIINSIRMLLQEDEFGRNPIVDTDFYKSMDKKVTAPSISVKGIFETTRDEESIAFLTCENSDGKTQLNLQVDNKENQFGRYKRIVWGGESRASAFEWDLFDTIRCIYLPPLRDAEAKLKEGKSSRLARLLKNLCKKDLLKHKKAVTLHPLEQEVKEFNEKLSSKNDAIKGANDLIKERLKEALGSVLGQDTKIQYAEQDFNRIVESLRLVFFPKITPNPTSDDLFRSLEENSLGYNNILYVATVLAELEYDDTSYIKVLLIEEPEAHLHPQLQVRLLKYLQSIKEVQIIVTTHSTVLASAVAVESLIHLSESKGIVTAVPIKECGLDEDTSLPFIKRWLDTTKSTLFFAKGIILVEGIAEAMLIPEMAKFVLNEYNVKYSASLPETLEDGGVSVINLNGIYFKHFMQLFCNIKADEFQNIPVRCSGITDQDPPKSIIVKDGKDKKKAGKFYPTESDINSGDSPVSRFNFPPSSLDVSLSDDVESGKELKGNNHALKIISKVNESEYARLYANRLKTLEYDLAMEGDNLNSLIPIAIDCSGSSIKELTAFDNEDWAQKTDIEKSKAAYELLYRIEKVKGEFAQVLADNLQDKTVSLVIPEYIKKAIIWACGGNPDA